MDICIFGASGRDLDKSYYDMAFELGALVAGCGHGIVFGGGAEGLMGACARGASSRGGKIIGVAPRFFDEPGILYQGCTELVFTETMRERKQVMQERSGACIVMPGGIGTLEEFFEVLTLKQLGRDGRAIVILNTNGCYNTMLRMLEELAEARFMSKNCLGLYFVAETVQQAVEYLESYVPQKGSIHRLEDYNN